ncbi:protein maelstrom homolog isoform X2 [Bradysia coprophila]|uniref:protein maelstrom homolog isoform X2 n=1 Tax=Bradysia coprophila TaxID=38358 RepID=UPI00187DCDC3|nr:protein maelstrom homolog isoform X2 [Bradysia coprophila]
MPKKPPKNGFFYYMLHFKEEERRKGRHYNALSDVSAAASTSWQNMTAQQRGPFEKQAKEMKCGPRREAEKYTSQGIALSVIERAQKKLEQENRTMMRTIQDTVVHGFTNNTIASQEFIFISGNYFININEHYLPAEIAMVRFSFEHGIISKFHTYVDPEKVPMGYLFDAKDNSEKTHRLPIPPNSKGERNYKCILDQMKQFMGEPMPILFTSKETIPMIKSFIQSFIDFGNNDDIDAYRVYQLHLLFFEIKEMAVKNSPTERKSFKSVHIAEEHLRRDDYAYLAGTACSYHEELDCAKYCALAHVQNWAYIFLDHICVDLSIGLISGKHFPPEIDISHVQDATQNDLSVSNLNDTEMNVTNDTKNRTYTEYTDEAQSSCAATASQAPSYWSGRPQRPEFVQSNDEAFPSLGSRKRVIDDPWNTSTSSSGSNPWIQRGEFESDSDEPRSFVESELNSSHLRGMGRGSALYRMESGFGRGGHRK